MLAERELRKVRKLKADARVAIGKIQWLAIGAWRIGIDCTIQRGHIVHWHFSARLLDRTQSTEDDWRMLGQLQAVVGAPHDPIVPIAAIQPTDVVHYAWLDGPAGPVALSVPIETVEAIQEAVRKRPMPA